MSEPKTIHMTLPNGLALLFVDMINLNLSHIQLMEVDSYGYRETFLTFRASEEAKWVKAGEQAGFKKGLASGRREIIEQLMHSG